MGNSDFLWQSFAWCNSTERYQCTCPRGDVCPHIAQNFNADLLAHRFILRANEKIAVNLAKKRDPRVIPEEAQSASLTFTVYLFFPAKS